MEKIRLAALKSLLAGAGVMPAILHGYMGRDEHEIGRSVIGGTAGGGWLFLVATKD